MRRWCHPRLPSRRDHGWGRFGQPERSWETSFRRRSPRRSGTPRGREAAPELWLSPLSVWGVHILAEKGRVTLDPDPITWIRRALTHVPFREASVKMPEMFLASPSGGAGAAGEVPEVLEEEHEEYPHEEARNPGDCQVESEPGLRGAPRRNRLERTSVHRAAENSCRPAAARPTRRTGVSPQAQSHCSVKQGRIAG